MKDVIRRQDAINALAKWFYDVFGIKESDGTVTIFKRLRELPSAQPDLSKEDWQLIKKLRSYHNGSYANVIDKLIASAQPMRWIPFNTRSLTEEEKEDHPEWDCILDCKLPDDGQAILVSINVRGHERVQYDKFFTDDGSYLDSGYEIGTEATAWMPLPTPYREE